MRQNQCTCITINYCADSVHLWSGRMDSTLGLVLTSIVVAALITYAVKLLNLLWLRPRKLEKLLRNQSLNGNPYRPFLGDAKDYAAAMKAEQLRSIQLSDDILPHIFGYFHTILKQYGKCCIYIVFSSLS